MLLEPSPIRDYRIVREQEVIEHLAQGFQLYGPPFWVADPIRAGIYQAVVKQNRSASSISHSMNPKPINPSIKAAQLTAVEKNYVQALARGLTYKQIAQEFYRSTSTVGNTLHRLRQRWSCPTDIALVLTLLHLGLIDL